MDFRFGTTWLPKGGDQKGGITNFVHITEINSFILSPTAFSAAQDSENSYEI